MITAMDLTVGQRAHDVALKARKVGIRPGRLNEMKTATEKMLRDITEDPMSDMSGRMDDIALDASLDLPETTAGRVRNTVREALDVAASGIRTDMRVSRKAGEMVVENPYEGQDLERGPKDDKDNDKLPEPDIR